MTPVQGPTEEAPQSATSFRRLAQDAGALYFPISLLARLPMSMLGMACLTYIVAAAEDFTTPGLVTAIGGVGAAIGTPISGALSDKLGQKPTLLGLCLIHVLALIGVLYFGSGSDGPVTLTPQLMIIALIAGASIPPSGPMTRVRWINRYGADLHQLRTLEAAQSYESTMDELSFVLGPASVGILAATFGPAVPIYVAMALCIVIIPAFAFHHTEAYSRFKKPRTTVTETTPATQKPPRRGNATLIAITVIGMLGVGTVFGSLATILTYFADYTGNPGTGGLIYAVMGITSGLAALSVARWPVTFSHPARLLTGAVTLVPLVIVLWLPETPLSMSLAILLLGVPIGPILVTNFTLASSITPSHRMGFVMTLLSAAITLGTSAGNSIAGRLTDAGGHHLALVATLGASVLVFICAFSYTVLNKQKQR